MIRFKEVAILYIGLLLKINLVASQWNNGYADYGSYYVPYPKESGPPLTSSGPIHYVPVQGSPINFVPTYQITNTEQSFEQNPSNGAYSPYGPNPPLSSPIYSNTPTVSYQGLDEANALRSAYPNQPIIIINNGGNGDTGGNSNNGNRNGKRDDGFNFGDLAAVLLATHRGHGHKGFGGELAPEPGPVAAPSVAVPPPAVSNPAVNNNYDYNAGRRDESRCNHKCTTVTNITIILPSSGGTVSVEEKGKNKKEKNTEVQQKKKCRDKGKDKEREMKDVVSDEEEDVIHDSNFDDENEEQDEDDE